MNNKSNMNYMLSLNIKEKTMKNRNKNNYNKLKLNQTVIDLYSRAKPRGYPLHKTVKD